jgi:hypothetical protein
MATPVTVNEVLDGQVALDLRCLDRIYLNAYVPNLQVGGQVVSFFDRALEPSTMQPATRSRAAEERLAGLQAARNMGLPPGSWAASLLVHLTRPATSRTRKMMRPEMNMTVPNADREVRPSVSPGRGARATAAVHEQRVRGVDHGRVLALVIELIQEEPHRVDASALLGNLRPRGGSWGSGNLWR